jgi:hypothetical protein
VYRIETEPLADDQIAHLPAEALAAFAEFRVVLETNPWGGEAYNPAIPNSAMRANTFGRAIVNTCGSGTFRLLPDPPAGQGLGAVRRACRP